MQLGGERMNQLFKLMADDVENSPAFAVLATEVFFNSSAKCLDESQEIAFLGLLLQLLNDKAELVFHCKQAVGTEDGPDVSHNTDPMSVNV